MPELLQPVNTTDKPERVERPRPVETDESVTEEESTCETGLLDEHDDEHAIALVGVVLGVVSVWESSADMLSEKGFTREESDCPSCSHGSLWSRRHEVVCERCATVFGGEDRRQRRSVRRENPWEWFRENRGSYRSGRKRCVGGYPHPYAWVTSDEISHAVADLAPGAFYK